jgi:hypothetical protein
VYFLGIYMEEPSKTTQTSVRGGGMVSEPDLVNRKQKNQPLVLCYHLFPFVYLVAIVVETDNASNEITLPRICRNSSLLPTQPEQYS